MAWVFATTAAIFGLFAVRTSRHHDRPMLIAIAVLSAVFMVAAIRDESDSRFDTTGCTRISRVWSWLNCPDDQLPCRLHLLKPLGCLAG